MIEFTVYGKPAQMGSKKAFYAPKLKRAFVVDDNSEKRKAWAHAVSCEAADAMHGRVLIDEPVRLLVEFFFARPATHFGSGKNAGRLKATAPVRHAQSPDLDKLVRCLGDALTGIVYRDDKLVCELTASRHWTEGQECAIVRVQLAEPKIGNVSKAIGDLRAAGLDAWDKVDLVAEPKLF